MTNNGGNPPLSELEILVLRSILNDQYIESIEGLAKVSSAILGKEIARLQLGGFIAEDGTLTEKGIKALEE